MLEYDMINEELWVLLWLSVVFYIINEYNLDVEVGVFKFEK